MERGESILASLKNGFSQAGADDASASTPSSMRSFKSAISGEQLERGELKTRKPASPYYKRNPRREGRPVASVHPGFSDVPMLREHLYRIHRLPIKCPRCQQQFISDQERTDHLDACGRFTPRSLTSNTKWKAIFMVLLPEASPGRFGQGLRMSVIFSLASTLPVAEAYPGQIQIESAQRGFLSLSAFMLAPFVFAYGNRRTVSGCLMGTSCFTWMTVKADPSAGITVTWSLFAVWMLSTVAFILDVAAGTDHGKLYMVLVIALTSYLMALSPVVQMLKNEDAVTLVAACASLSAFLVSLPLGRRRNRLQHQSPEDAA